jgi:hypothetical protein
MDGSTLDLLRLCIPQLSSRESDSGRFVDILFGSVSFLQGKRLDGVQGFFMPPVGGTIHCEDFIFTLVGGGLILTVPRSLLTVKVRLARSR